jgi:hypothetical protein
MRFITQFLFYNCSMEFNYIYLFLSDILHNDAFKAELVGWIFLTSYFIRKKINLYMARPKKVTVLSDENLRENFDNHLIAGIEQSKDLRDVLLAICTTVNTVDNVLSDGKLNFADIGYIFALSAPITEAISGKENVIKELAMIKPEGLQLEFAAVRSQLTYQKDPFIEMMLESIIIGIVAVLAVAAKKMVMA